MKAENLKSRIIRRALTLSIPKQRIVYSYVHTLLFYRKLRGEGLKDLPMDRPAPGKIVEVMSGMLDQATIRELICILKFTSSVRKNM